MSKYPASYGNGARCDVCNFILEPFETLRLCGLKLMPGPTYDTCSSDVRYKRISKFHLCQKCYNDIVDKIKPSV